MRTTGLGWPAASSAPPKAVRDATVTGLGWPAGRRADVVPSASSAARCFT